MNYFKWVNILIESKVVVRQNLVKHCLEAIRTFKKGETTKEGIAMSSYLAREKSNPNIEPYIPIKPQFTPNLIGFCPEISYIMANHKDKDNLNVLWNHKFSIPTLLYHIKGTPFLLLANANLDYNNSKLLEIDENKSMADELKWDGILG